VKSAKNGVGAIALSWIRTQMMKVGRGPVKLPNEY